MGKKSYYLLKPSSVQKVSFKQEIIRKPWTLPMAAQQLAAITIQKHVRQFLTLKRFKLGTLFLTKPQPQAKPADQQLKEKFRKASYKNYSEEDYKEFCASLIQASWRMHITRRVYKFHRFAMYHVAAIQIQWAWRSYCRRRKDRPPLTLQRAVSKIQNLWRNYTNVKIFKYYKQLIQFKLKGDPRELLRTINPVEASLIDKASNVHVRFRLGGEAFPPLIYYKIYVNAGLCDLNSFAPRDYTAVRKITKKTTVNMTFEGPEAKQVTSGWYERYDNNGWRPITDNIIVPFDKVELYSASKPVTYHYDKAKRKELTAKQRRIKKLRWLRKLYADAKRQEEQEKEEGQKASADNLFDVSGESMASGDNPFDDEELIDLPDDKFEEHVNQLLEWSETLDFDKYISHWWQVATSAPSNSMSQAFEFHEEEVML